MPHALPARRLRYGEESTSGPAPGRRQASWEEAVLGF